MTNIPSEMTEPAINRPEIETEVRAAVLRYEAALTGNNLAVLDELFWSSARTVRYGVTECLYGKDDIDAFRKSRPSKGLNRSIQRLEITTLARISRLRIWSSDARENLASDARVKLGYVWSRDGVS